MPKCDILVSNQRFPFFLVSDLVSLKSGLKARVSLKIGKKKPLLHVLTFLHPGSESPDPLLMHVSPVSQIKVIITTFDYHHIYQQWPFLLVTIMTNEEVNAGEYIRWVLLAIDKCHRTLQYRSNTKPFCQHYHHHNCHRYHQITSYSPFVTIACN